MGRILPQPYSIIYALTAEGENATTESVRYIGKTAYTASHRLGKHMVSVRTGCHFHSHNWIRSLVKSGLSPQIHILAIVSHEDSAFFECLFIRHFRSQGARLANLTDGGEGPAGRKNTPEQSAALSRRLRGKKLSAARRSKQQEILREVRKLPQFKKACGDAVRKTTARPDVRAKISAARKGCSISPEQRAQISKTLTGRKQSLDTIKKREASLETIRRTPEYKEKHRIAVTNWWARRKGVGGLSL